MKITLTVELDRDVSNERGALDAASVLLAHDVENYLLTCAADQMDTGSKAWGYGRARVTGVRDVSAQWVVMYDIGDNVNDFGGIAGPYETEDDCFAAAASFSREPNDWMPVRLSIPESVVAL